MSALILLPWSCKSPAGCGKLSTQSVGLPVITSISERSYLHQWGKGAESLLYPARGQCNLPDRFQNPYSTQCHGNIAGWLAWPRKDLPGSPQTHVGVWEPLLEKKGKKHNSGTKAIKDSSSRHEKIEQIDFTSSCNHFPWDKKINKSEERRAQRCLIFLN